MAELNCGAVIRFLDQAAYRLPPPFDQGPSMVVRSLLILPSNLPPICFISTFSDEPDQLTNVALRFHLED